MKIKQVSEHIWSLKTWVVIPIHVWFVVDENGVTLVDAGIPMMAKGIMKGLKQLDRGPLKRIQRLEVCLGNSVINPAEQLEGYTGKMKKKYCLING